MSEINMIETEGTVVENTNEKQGILARAKNKAKTIDKKKVGKAILRVVEGCGLLIGGYMIGVKCAKVPIPVEGTVTESEEPDGTGEEA